MGERLDRALDLLERLVCAMERLAERDARPAPLPPRRGRQRSPAPPRPPEVEPDEVTRQKARRALERAGIR